MSMRNALDDRSLKMHHLRHSFATLLRAKLLPNTASSYAEEPEKDTMESRQNRKVNYLDLGSTRLKSISLLLSYASQARVVGDFTLHALGNAWILFSRYLRIIHEKVATPDVLRSVQDEVLPNCPSLRQ
jgi:hypothetical protein